LTFGAIPDSNPDSTVLIRPAGTSTIVGISRTSFLSGLTAMSFKWSGNTTGSGGNIAANGQLVWAPGDAGMIGSSGGLMAGTAGSSPNTTCAASVGTATGLNAYLVPANATGGVFGVYIPYFALAGANGANIQFVLWKTTDPGNASDYTSLVQVQTGVLTVPGGAFAFSNTSFTNSISAGDYLILTVGRIDTASTSILGPLTMTATVLFTT
jgi:hypothetical protein